MTKTTDALVKFATFAAIIVGMTGASHYSTLPGTPPVISQGFVQDQESAEVGELVQFEANGHDVVWKVLPEVTDIQVFGKDDQRMVVSFREPGEYTIVAAVYDDDGIVIHLAQLTVVAPKLIVIVPPVVVVPDPNPVPRPVIAGPIASQVVAWADQDTLTKSQAINIASVFDKVANEITAKRLITARGVIARTASLNKQLNLPATVTIFDKFQVMLNAEAAAGRLDTLEDHARVWNSASYGLRAYAAQLSRT